MTASTLRTVPWVVGVGLIVVTLVGANKLLHRTDGTASIAGGDAGGKNHAATAASPNQTGGTVVLGTVDSDPPPVAVGPPAVAGMATVDKVLVVDGATVKVGDPLIQFDDAIFQTKLKQAQAEAAAAAEDVVRADSQRKIHAITLDRQKDAVQTALSDHKEAYDYYGIALTQFNDVLKTERSFSTNQPLTTDEKKKRINENLDLRRLANLTNNAKAKADDEQKKLTSLELAPVEADYRAAQQKVKRLEATVAEAQAAIDACLVRAKVAGVVEQVAVGPGATVGPGFRGPLLWIVPTGPRVVRAEVEAEFASKIADKLGKPVTVYDHNNFALTYAGTVRRIGTSFLPKRSGDPLGLTPTRVLECLIDVPDPSPAGKPPLRVGQPVRISFP